MDTSLSQSIAQTVNRKVAHRLVNGSGGGGYGPELLLNDGLWNFTGTVQPTQDVTGIHFVGASNIAGALHALLTKDQTTYDVDWEVVNRTLGGVHLIIYGGSNGHAGITPTRFSDGRAVDRITTTAGGTNNKKILVQATGASNPGNTYDVIVYSVREVLP